MDDVIIDKNMNNCLTFNQLIENSLVFLPSNVNFHQKIYVPIHDISIYCHSLLIDKLGDLTKFLITELFIGHNIETIEELTQISPQIIFDEIQYLKKGGLISDDMKLTTLGTDYGRLLVMFQKYAAGVPAYLNSFMDTIESKDDNISIYETNQEICYLKENFSYALTKNQNYSNSLEFILPFIEPEEMPFLDEVKKSLYTTVKVSHYRKYKIMYLTDITGITPTIFDNDYHFFSIQIPIIKVTLKMKHIALNSIREKISNIYRNLSELQSICPDLISEYGNKILNYISLENQIGTFSKYYNFFTGEEELPSLIEEPCMKLEIVLSRNQILDLLATNMEKWIIDLVNFEIIYNKKYYPYECLLSEES